MAHLSYQEWRETAEGKAKIFSSLREADIRAEYDIQLRKIKEQKLLDKYHSESMKRARENGLMYRLGPNGALDDDYYAELPLDIGYHISEEGNKLEFVSLGGVDITDLLPPNIMEEIMHRLEND